MTVGCLVDTTRCIGCRSCQVACKGANDLTADETRFFAAAGGYQNPRRFSPYTRTLITYHEIDQPDDPPRWIFVKHQCLHCTDLYCAEDCAPEVFHRTASGVVAFDAPECIGCAACLDSCPFDVPAIDYWDVDTPHIRKCDFCLGRQEADLPAASVDGRRRDGPALQRHRQSFSTPGCAKACPTGALRFGRRDQLLAEAKRRIAAEPEKYVNHVYGETEAGGTAWLYLASVPFTQLGFPESLPPLGQSELLGATDRSSGRWLDLGSCLTSLVAGMSWFFRRRDTLRRTKNTAAGEAENRSSDV